MAEEVVVVVSGEEVDAAANNKENSQLKRRCFSMLPSLFRKSSRFKGNQANFAFRRHCSFEVLSDDKLSISSFPITDSCLAPGSPISPRVKNFNSDMRNLANSRRDNPFISQQIELDHQSSSEYSDLSTPILSVRKSRPSYFNINKKATDFTSELFELSSDDSSNLHEKLIRSPPPHFPEKLSQFVFTESYIGQIIDDK
ncbi:hypothetical protein TYRP_000875 [Tyrophagus putrescentiae]|nr:hypothetical protein TYRP_000875 [Tyrophagus putrescentiae]